MQKKSSAERFKPSKMLENETKVLARQSK